jgi:hypothetical protein
LSQLRPAIRRAAFAGFAIHTLAVLWIWQTWDAFGASNLLIWMSLPASLAYLEASGTSLLGLALLFGGLEWALLGGLVAWWIGRSLHRRSEEAEP